MKTNYPLPLELTRPVELASPLENEMGKVFGVGDTWYNPVTQVRETAEGTPRFLDHGEGGCCGSKSSQESESKSGCFVIDVTVDIQIDDNNL
jgi:hypothetical protein